MRFVQAMKWFEGNSRLGLLVLICRGRHPDNYQHLIISHHWDFIAVLTTHHHHHHCFWRWNKLKCFTDCQYEWVHFKDHIMQRRRCMGKTRAASQSVVDFCKFITVVSVNIFSQKVNFCEIISAQGSKADHQNSHKDQSSLFSCPQQLNLVTDWVTDSLTGLY